MTIVLIGVAILCSCHSPSVHKSERKQIRQLGYADPYHERFPIVLITDGGSRPVPFMTVDGEVMQLVLDRSLREDPETGKVRRTENGHLYWGYENLEKRNTIDYDSDFATELLQAMCEYLAEQRDPTSEYSRLKPFLDKILIERNTSFHKSLGSEQTPAGDSLKTAPEE